MFTSIGDLAHSLYTTRRSVALKTELQALSQELTTGKVRDIAGHLGADQRYFADIESRLSRLESFDLATTEAKLFGASSQEAVGRLQTLSGKIAADFITTANAGLANGRSQQATKAADDLSQMISTLNGSVAGRSLFSGISTDVAPLEDADTLLAAVRSEIAGATTVSDIQSRIDSWFADPAGFQATMYRGSAQNLAEIRVSEEVGVSFETKADDPAFKEALKLTAIAAISDDATLALTNDERMTLLENAGVGLTAASAELAEVSSEIGAVEARVETTAARNSATKTSLEFSRTELISADAYEVSIRLEDVQFQLQALYLVTSRNAELSLVNVL